MAIQLGPQSNQRGIEKLNGQANPTMSEGPQSNQRGIENVINSQDLVVIINRLNRTSVGLKSLGWRLDGMGDAGPQSNQRGIEKQLVGQDVVVTVSASIEPAWD